MAKYVFSNGKITIEDGLYVPMLRRDKANRRGVVVLALQAQLAAHDESRAKQEHSHDPQ